MKKFIIPIIVIIVVCILVGTVFNTKKSIATPNTEKAWEKKYPDAFKSVGDIQIKINASQVVSISNIDKSESMVKLEGTITNKLGIRDDILEYIINIVPKNNPLIMRAALKMAKIQQIIYFEDISAEDAIKLADNDALITSCLYDYTNSFDISDGIDKLMRNTKSRDENMWVIDRKYFSWKIIGSGLSVADEKIACEKGEF